MAVKQLILLLSILLFSFTNILLAIMQVKVTYILLSFRHLLVECAALCARELIKGEIPKRERVQRHCICNQYILHYEYEENN